MPIPHPKSKLSPPSDAMRGLIAENAVASLLNLLTLERENLFVFHSISEEENPVGETDHILLYKRMLLIIETKNRSNISDLKLTKDGELIATKAGKDFTVNGNNILKKIDKYKSLYPALDVKGVIVAHHATQTLTSEVANCNLTQLNTLIPYVLEQVDAVEKNSVDVIPIIKDIAIRCIRNENIN